MQGEKWYLRRLLLCWSIIFINTSLKHSTTNFN